MSRAAQEWWRAVMRELAAMPVRAFPDLSVDEGARLKLAQAMDLAREKGAVMPEESPTQEGLT